MGKWINEICHRKLEWRRNFFNWKEESLSHLMEVITPAPITEEKDSWSYIMEVCVGTKEVLT
jgi:hypothetical protein